MAEKSKPPALRAVGDSSKSAGACAFKTMIQIDTKIFPKNRGAYIVGGAIRDILCGRPPLDYDVAVVADPQIIRMVAWLKLANPAKKSFAWLQKKP
jgi:hypothetical protein